MIDSLMQNIRKEESESLNSVILFVKEIVPNEAQNAQKKRERFDDPLDIIGLKRKMSAGQRVTLYGSDPATVAEEWRDVAKQYQLTLENGNNRAFIVTRTNNLKIITSRIFLTIPLQILLDSVTCRLGPDHLFDQLLVWFVYIPDSPLFPTTLDYS